MNPVQWRQQSSRVANKLVSFWSSSLILKSERRRVGWPGRSRQGCGIIGNIWKSCPLWSSLWATHKWDYTCLTLMCVCVDKLDCFGVWLHMRSMAAVFPHLLLLFCCCWLFYMSTCSYCWQVLLSIQDDMCTCIQTHSLTGAQEDRHAGSQPWASSPNSTSFLSFFIFLIHSISPALPTWWERPAWSFSGPGGYK